MAAQEYKIAQVDEETKTWQSAYGEMVTYTLLLDETGEEIIQQNKKPDSPAPKVGDVLYGHIERNAFGAKFKTEARPLAAKPSGSAPAAYKDHSKGITLGMVWKTVAGIRGLPENKTDFEQFFLIVREHLDELLLMIDQMNRSGGVVSDNLPQTLKVAEQPAAEPIQEKLKKGFSEYEGEDEIHS